MSNQIVTVNVSQQVAAAPSQRQRTGAFISQGGTTKAANTLTLLTQLSDLTSILSAGLAVSTISWSGGTATVTTTNPHGWTIGDVVGIVISGESPAGYNGSFQGTVTGANTVAYPLSVSPGSQTVAGLIVLADEAELLAMGTTYFDQGSGNSVYVLELGEGTATEGVAALNTWITSSESSGNVTPPVYSWLVPREWDANAAFLAFLPNYTAVSNLNYFHVTTTLSTYSAYLNTKCVLTTIQAPAAPVTEFTAAAQFWVTLNWAPSSTNKVPPLAFSYVYGVTAYPIPGNSSTLATLKAANVGYIGTGAEGGISTAILLWGRTMDGNQFNYWYSVNAAQINLEENLANAVINGSNSNINPMYYNQQGINTLQDVASNTVSNLVSYGLAVGSVKQTQLPLAQFTNNFANGAYIGQLVINAEPFLVYTNENPSAYATGTYGGLSAVYTPQLGFQQIIFNLGVVNFS